MRHNSRKKFRRFLEQRRQRLHRPDAWKRFWHGIQTNPKLLYTSLWPPFLALALYVGGEAFGFFTSLHEGLHVAALILLLLWLLSSLRSAAGFWPRWRHVQFAGGFALFVILGSCWSLGGADSAKAWVTPPEYARLPSEPLTPSLYGNKAPPILAGSLVQVSLSGALAKGAVASFAGKEKRFEEGEGDSTLSFAVPSAEKPQKLTLLLRRGQRRLGLWTLSLVPDLPPQVAFTEEPSLTMRKTLRLAYEAMDDYGIEKILVQVSPESPASSMAHKPVEIVLTKPGVKVARKASYADLTSLPWAGAAAIIQLVAVDGAGHKSFSAPKQILLPSRSFHNPFARALIEERQKLLGRPDASARDEAANVMAGIARQQGLFRGDPVIVMTLRAGAVRLVLNETSSTLAAVRGLMWQAALRLEEGAIGLARSDLAVAGRDLSSLLMRDSQNASLAPFLFRMRKSLETYFAALKAERAKRPLALQDVEWPLATGKDVLTPEDLENQMSSVEAFLAVGAHAQALSKLDQLQAFIENLRTTPPELTPDQYKLVEQTSSLRALVRGQKKLLEETEGFKGTVRKDAVTHMLAQQQILLAALRETVGKIEATTRLEAKAGEKAMIEAIQALQKKNLALTQQKQAEALALMENSLLALSEQMRRALTAQVP